MEKKEFLDAAGLDKYHKELSQLFFSKTTGEEQGSTLEELRSTLEGLQSKVNSLEQTVNELKAS